MKKVCSFRLLIEATQNDLSPVIVGNQQSRQYQHLSRTSPNGAVETARCDKKYGECLNKKIITIKDTLPLIPFKMHPLTSNTLIPSF
jgi:hypothetical protein